MYAISGLVIVR